MAEALRESALFTEMPDIDHIITEDDEPVDNLFSAKQQRLLVEPLYSSWKPERLFLADANVGIFNAVYQPPIVPDMFLSLDVQPDEDIWKKENRSYFMWIFGKPPEVVIEVVSNTKDGETEKKFHKYARIGAWYYAIFDPQRFVQEDLLCIYQLSLGVYQVKSQALWHVLPRNIYKMPIVVAIHHHTIHHDFLIVYLLLPLVKDKDFPSEGHMPTEHVGV